MEQTKPRRSVIRWDDDEWDRLAELVYTMRRNSSEAVATLANRAQKQFPKDRQRGALAIVNLQPLWERIQRREQEERMRAEKCEEYAAKLSFFTDLPDTKEGILESLTEEELRQRFFPRMMQMLTPADVVATFPAEELLHSVPTPDLAAVIARRLVCQWERPINLTVQIPEQQTPVPKKPRGVNGNATIGTNGKRKHFLVVGTSRDQPRHIREGVGLTCELSFVELDRHSRFEAFPKNVDHVFVWSKFLTHRQSAAVLDVFEPQRVTQHFGGVSQLVALIKEACAVVLV